MDPLIELDSGEVLIDFAVSLKCRTDVHLRSLHPTAPVAFKVQTSSPHKFLVNPPSGLLPPLGEAAFQVILRPQAQVPESFPRSATDRFLVKAAVAGIDSRDQAAEVNRWFAARPGIGTSDVKLKVVYGGAVLLRRAVEDGDADAVRQIVRRQKSLVPLLSLADTTSLLQTASVSHDPTILELLVEAGLDQTTNHDTTTRAKEMLRSKSDMSTSKCWTALHNAAAAGSYETLVEIIEESNNGELDCRDTDGRTPLHLATSKGYMRCVRALVEKGADKNARSKDGRTALHRAAANGDQEMVALLLDVGADPAVPTHRGRTPMDVAQDKGHKEVVEILERGELVLTAARRGDLRRLESLLRKGVSTNSCDQYGTTPLHSAAIKGHEAVVRLLAAFGTNLDCRDVEGHTPLHLGVEGGWADVVEALLDLGADVNARTKRGATPLLVAKSIGYDEIARLLVSRGATLSDVASSSSSLSSCG